MAKFSVVICCANAADTLEAACRSAKWADELVVVDSGSTDATAEIAQRYADIYKVEPWRGYSKQKEYGASLASHDWVFILDSDEVISDGLASEIKALTDDALAGSDVFLMRRRNHVMGRYVRAWSPDWQSRLIHRDRVTWSDDVLHEDRLPASPDRVGRLTGRLEHKPTDVTGFADYFSGARMDERLLAVARQMHAKGKRCGIFDLVFRPRFAFWKFYLLKGGILDGAFGLLIAQKAAVSTQLKYAALWAVQHGLDETGHRQDDDSSAS